MSSLTLKTSNNPKPLKGNRFDVYDIQYDVQLAANIVDLRKARGLTQKELADNMGLLQPAIARAENGNKPPSHKLLKKIARACNARILPPAFQLVESWMSFAYGASSSVSAYSDSSEVLVTTNNKPSPVPCVGIFEHGNHSIV